MNASRHLMAALAALAVLGASARAGDLKWKQHTINGRSEFEAAGVFDVDGDGRLDIVSGDTWYRGPEWTPYPVRDVTRQGSYFNDFATLPVDVNGDGRTDFVTCAYFSQDVAWIENPGSKGKEWTYHEIDKPGRSEAGVFVDLTGDGIPEVLPNTVNTVVFYTLTKAGPEPVWTKVDLGKEAAGHGVGSGDVNGDGRVDILTLKGWLEAPETPLTDAWTFHPDWQLGPAGIQILARDVNGDGLSDVVWGMGHNFGLYWLEQGKADDGKPTWTKHVIDESYASVHTLMWADLDGDGQDDEMLTGKRVYAHEKEPGDVEASTIAYYTFDTPSQSWTKHTIFQGEPARDAPADPKQRSAQKDFPPGTAGTGLQMTVIDIDADGDNDIVCPGKSGLYWFENLGPSS